MSLPLVPVASPLSVTHSTLIWVSPRGFCLSVGFWTLPRPRPTNPTLWRVTAGAYHHRQALLPAAPHQKTFKQTSHAALSHSLQPPPSIPQPSPSLQHHLISVVTYACPSAPQTVCVRTHRQTSLNNPCKHGIGQSSSTLMLGSMTTIVRHSDTNTQPVNLDCKVLLLHSTLLLLCVISC